LGFSSLVSVLVGWGFFVCMFCDRAGATSRLLKRKGPKALKFETKNSLIKKLSPSQGMQKNEPSDAHARCYTAPSCHKELMPSANYRRHLISCLLAEY